MLTVTETPNGITVRQDRFLETGPAEPKDNETIWCAFFRFSYYLFGGFIRFYVMQDNPVEPPFR